MLYLNKMNEKMKNEMDKAFADYRKACDKVIGDCQIFIDMDINKKPTRSEDKVIHRSGQTFEESGYDNFC